MGYYWATFKRNNDNFYRYDTRIYFEPINQIEYNDICIGAVVGKNPGSALPVNLIENVPCEINLSNDKLLPTLKNIFAKANPSLGGRQYVQVLNLFYLCNPNLNDAIRDYKKNNDGPFKISCHSENKNFKWLWFLWGGKNNQLTDMKSRFREVKTEKYFFLNNADKKIHEEFPDNNICAKHTQGMSHDLVIPYLKEILK